MLWRWSGSRSPLAPEEEHHRGHHRCETLVSLAIAAMTTFDAAEVVRRAIRRLQAGSSLAVMLGSFVIMMATVPVNTGVSLRDRCATTVLASVTLGADAILPLGDIMVSLGVIAVLAGDRGEHPPGRLDHRPGWLAGVHQCGYARPERS